jgi:hypothetical protein
MAMEARTLDVQYGNTSNYVTTSNLDKDASLGGYYMPLRLWLNASGTATYNSNAMNILYPNATAHPVKMHITSSYGVLGAPIGNAHLKVDNTTVWSIVNVSNGSQNIDAEVEHTALSNSTKTSSIVWNLT